MLEKSSQSFLGPGCREFESRHSDQNPLTAYAARGFCFCLGETRIIQNAICRWHIAATSANTGGYRYLRLLAQMQTSLATRAISLWNC